MSENEPKPEKILEKPLMGGIAVPIAIVLVGALIIFGVTRMLSVGKSYKDLVTELHSKTFGNRWVAAYELSKVIASNSVPEEDKPWLVENLSTVYKNSIDARTRNFVILALGNISTKECVGALDLGTQDKDPQVKFNSVVSLGNLAPDLLINFKWNRVISLLASDDAGLRQVSSYALANHYVKDAETEISKLLSDGDINVRYAAAISLIPYQNKMSVNTLKEISNLSYSVKLKEKYNAAQVEVLKLSMITALKKSKWNVVNAELSKMVSDAGSAKVSVRAQELLNILKN
jgi:HEAT repeat protein